MSKTVLVVEPNQSVREFITLILESEGHNTVKVSALEDAADYLLITHLDLIITEAFDQKNIYKFCPDFLTQLSVCDTPILLCSIYPSAGDLRTGDFGLSEIISKPFSIEELEVKINHLLGIPGDTDWHHCL